MNAPSRTSRQKLEALALKPFMAAANDLGLSCLRGQGSGNRLSIGGNVYFQFGDLRIEQPNVTIVIEVESSGGVTNLAKYWESIASQRLSKPIRLLHLFRQKSENDYLAHMVVWDFLALRMKESLGDKFEGVCRKYRDGFPESLEPAVSLFKQWLCENAA